MCHTDSNSKLAWWLLLLFQLFAYLLDWRQSCICILAVLPAYFSQHSLQLLVASSSSGFDFP